MKEKRYFKKCLKFLDFFGVDYSKDIIYLTSGGNSCICNPKGKFAKDFGGHSINGIARYVAEKLNKETAWKEEEFL